MNFAEGDCPIMAIALNHLTGLPMKALVEFDYELECDVLIHAYVKSDAADFPILDCNGFSDKAWILDKFPHGGGSKEVDITEADLLKMGYGDSPVPDINLVYPIAKNVLEDCEFEYPKSITPIPGEHVQGTIFNPGPAFKYVQLPALNGGEFPLLDAEMASRGVRAEYSDLLNGGRIYRVSIDDLHMLPIDEAGPYFGDLNSGHSLSSLGGDFFEHNRINLSGTPWMLIESNAELNSKPRQKP